MFIMFTRFFMFFKKKLINKDTSLPKLVCEITPEKKEYYNKERTNKKLKDEIESIEDKNNLLDESILKLGLKLKREKIRNSKKKLDVLSLIEKEELSKKLYNESINKIKRINRKIEQIKKQKIDIDNKIIEINKDREKEGKTLIKKKLKLREVENYDLFKSFGLFLSIATILGASLAFYYIFIYSKG